MIFDLLSNSILSFILGCFIVLLTLLFVGAISYLILYFINTVYTTPILNGRGTIIRKNYEVGKNKVVMLNDPSTNTITPTLQYEDELWTIFIKVDNKIDEVEVSEEDYHRYEVGEQKNIQYVVGKLWKAVFIKKILDK